MGIIGVKKVRYVMARGEFLSSDVKLFQCAVQNTSDTISNGSIGSIEPINFQRKVLEGVNLG